MRKWVALALVLVSLVVLAGVTIARLTAEEEVRTFTVRRDQDQGPSSPVIALTSVDMAAFPPEARSGWREALENGTAQFTLRAQAAENYSNHLQTLATRDGVSTMWRFHWENTYFSQSERLH